MKILVKLFFLAFKENSNIYQFEPQILILQLQLHFCGKQTTNNNSGSNFENRKSTSYYFKMFFGFLAKIKQLSFT
jgi:hypothetical protein